MSQDKDPSTIELHVHEEVKMSELHPGDTAQKELTQEEIISRVMERRMALAKEYVKPHNKKSRRVTEEDLERVINDAKIMYEMCLVGHDKYFTAFAIAHTQVNDEDPLRFYVTSDGFIVVNPVIISHTNYFDSRQEGCMSFPEEPMKTVLRFNKLTLRYQTVVYSETKEDGIPIGEPRLSQEVETKYNGKSAEVVQHECSHLNGRNIYDENYGPLSCIGE